MKASNLPICVACGKEKNEDIEHICSNDKNRKDFFKSCNGKGYK